jgi:hypothetical protein
MEKTCGVYFTDDYIYVITSSQTTIGLRIGTDPRFKLKRTDSASTLGKSVIKALDASRHGIPMPADLRSVTIDFLSFVGFKTLNSFEKGATYFSVTLTAKGVNIIPSTRGRRRGFDHHPAEAVECRADPDVLGETLLKLASPRQIK